MTLRRTTTYRTVPTQTVHVFVPSDDNMAATITTFNQDGPLDRAIAAWNTALAGTGVNFDIVFDENDCGSGGDCIELGEVPDASEDVTGIEGCAGTTPGAVTNNQTGITTTPTTLQLNDLMWKTKVTIG